MNKKLEELKKNVLQRIEHGEVSMRPRWHFVLKGALILAGIVLLALGLVYLLSFAVFVLKHSGVFFVPLFGFRGVVAFVYSSPWLLFLAAFVFLVALEMLVRQYSFSYKKPLIYMVLGMFGLSLFATYVVAQTPMHERLEQYAERHELPIVGPMYRGYRGMDSERVHTGQIVSVSQSGFVMENRRGDAITVEVTAATRRPREIVFAEGMTVVVLGDRTEEGIDAFGVRPVPEDVVGIGKGMGRGEHMHAPRRNTY